MPVSINTRSLYLCYFALREPLVRSQVLPYLRELSSAGVEVHLLTFEPALRHWLLRERQEWRERLASAGIEWHALPYHKRPGVLATLMDVWIGGWHASRLVRRYGIEIIHARAHIAAAMGAMAKKMTADRNPRLIFDIRGFNPEEYVDMGLWREGGWIYRLVKHRESQLLDAADGFVVLTEKAREILFPGNAASDWRGRPIEVIPCCVDLDRFPEVDDAARARARRDLGLEDRRVMIYIGSLGGFYLTEQLAAFLAVAHEQDPRTYSIILTQSPADLIAERLQKLGVSEQYVLIRRVSPTEVSHYLRAADIGLSFIKPSYSKQASSPTKVAEYLASGLPVICNAGIGDLDRMIEEDRVGVLLRRFDRDGFEKALDAIDAMRVDRSIVARCRACAVTRFDLRSVGGERYCELYRRVLNQDRHVRRSLSWTRSSTESYSSR